VLLKVAAVVTEQRVPTASTSSLWICLQHRQVQTATALLKTMMTNLQLQQQQEQVIAQQKKMQAVTVQAAVMIQMR
jgi:hypothetical protein